MCDICISCSFFFSGVCGKHGFKGFLDFPLQARLVYLQKSQTEKLRKELLSELGSEMRNLVSKLHSPKKIADNKSTSLNIDPLSTSINMIYIYWQCIYIYIDVFIYKPKRYWQFFQDVTGRWRAVDQISMDSVCTFSGAQSVMSRDITLRGSCVKGILPKMAFSYKLEVGEAWKSLETFSCNSHFDVFFWLVKVKQKVVCSPSGATRLGSTFLAGQDGEDQQSNREITSNEASENLIPHGGLSKMYETLVLKSGEDLSFQKC